ncbi:hypothetical protein [Streptomyces chrestomyceticus]|uniref:hypothetical protein n=1 Tax=Streptomyces chrestomyceticus TaxID=68185 RepID=UPI00379F3BC1
MTEHEGAVERAKQYEGAAARYAKKAMEGDAGAAQLAQTFASLAVAARMERLDWRMRVPTLTIADPKPRGRIWSPHPAATRISDDTDGMHSVIPRLPHILVRRG